VASQIPLSSLPPESDVEVSVKIHTPLNVSALVAKQKANTQIALHCGQSFSLDEPEIQVGERVAIWRGALSPRAAPPAEGQRGRRS
jgi:hypothetical protein